MFEINIPYLRTFFSKKPYKPEFFDLLFKKIKEKRSEGFDLILAETPKQKVYFVIMDGDPLGAVSLEEQAFKLLNGRDYFNLLGSLSDISLSMYAIDPVFAKCLLVPAQNKPVFSGPLKEKDLKAKMDAVRADKGENIVVLKDSQAVNFFYFKNGRGVESYFFQPGQKPMEDDLGDQLLVYALSHDISVLSMEIYHKPVVHPLLEKPLTPDEISQGIVATFLKQKPKPTAVEKLDFDLEIEAAALAGDAPGGNGKNGKGKWCLELVGGEQMGRRIVFNKPQLTIGRMKVDLMLGDVKVSRQHATIELTDQGYRFTDLGSTNGSFINGQAVKTQILNAGDLIRLGGTLIKILCE